MRYLFAGCVAIALLATHCPRAAEGRSSAAREVTESSSPNDWDIRYDTVYVHRVVRKHTDIHAVQITYRGGTLPVERVEELFPNDPDYPLYTYPNSDPPLIAGIRVFRTTIPAPGVFELPNVGDQMAVAAMPTVVLAYSVDNTPEQAGAGAVRLTQVITWDTYATKLGEGPVHFERTPIGGDAVPRLDVTPENKVSVCRFGVNPEQPSVLVFVDAPGVANLRDYPVPNPPASSEDGTTIGLLRNGTRYNLFGTCLVRDIIALHTLIEVDSSPRHDGSAFVPFFGMDWGITTFVNVFSHETSLDYLLELTPRTDRPVSPGDDGPIKKGTQNGELHTDAFFQVIP